MIVILLKIRYSKNYQNILFKMAFPNLNVMIRKLGVRNPFFSRLT